VSMTGKAPELYRKYLLDKNFERLDLFQCIDGKYDIQRVLYPGSYVHITPSFFFPDVVYVDSDKGAKKFFDNQKLLQDFVYRRKNHLQKTKVTFHFSDYRNGIDEIEESFDLLISQYAGFVGQHCKRYLKKGGLLLANNSHGDAGVAASDDGYRLIAVVQSRSGKYRISETNLKQYFVPKASKVHVTKENLLELGRGMGYKKSASDYVFRREK
jgi:hypothetical protein